MYNKRSLGRDKHKHEEHNDCTRSAYVLTNSTFSQQCTGHFIRTAAVCGILLSAIQKVSACARENEAEFIERIRETSTVRQADTARAHKRQFARNERRIAELDMLFRKV